LLIFLVEFISGEGYYLSVASKFLISCKKLNELLRDLLTDAGVSVESLLKDFQKLEDKLSVLYFLMSQ